MADIDIEPILTLSCLSIDDDKKPAFKQQLGQILDYMQTLNNVTQEADPKFEWPIQKNNVDRDDTPVSFAHPQVESNAPEFKDGCFGVPKILE